MLKIIVIAVVCVIAVILIFAATKPNTFRIERSVSIQAGQDKIFAYLNDFHTWSSWSPWEKMDPAMKRTFSGPDKGKGAAYAWEGNKKVGQGRMEITDSTAPNQLIIRLDFLKPFEAHNINIFTLDPKEDSTQVTWVMKGPSPYLMKVMHIFFNMDKMVGRDFETGLANLKALAEK